MNQQVTQNTLPEPAEYVSDKFCSIRYEISRATWWRWVREGHAPKPYRFTSQCTRWKLSDVMDWEASRELTACK